jgi:hypothetical protein
VRVGKLRAMELEHQQLDRRHEGLRTRQPQRERRLLASLSQSGQQVPIVVVRGSDAERYVVVDGFKRVRALVRLGVDTVLGTCWEMSEPEALIVDRLLVGSERASALEQGWLLRDLVRERVSGMRATRSSPPPSSRSGPRLAERRSGRAERFRAASRTVLRVMA